MLRDEKLYPDAHSFVPERYLVEADEATTKLRDPRHYVFGFGRRRCPGQHLIEESFWIVIATMVATLDISKAVDADGKVIEPNVTFDNAVFRCALLCLTISYTNKTDGELTLTEYLLPSNATSAQDRIKHSRSSDKRPKLWASEGRSYSFVICYRSGSRILGHSRI